MKQDPPRDNQPPREGWYAVQHEDGGWRVNLMVGGEVTWYVKCSKIKEHTPEQCRQHAVELASRLNAMYGYGTE